MTTLYEKITETLNKRARYNRIVEEIEAMPLETSWDLDIYRGDARKIAYETVYGSH